MKTGWTKGLNEEQQILIKKEFVASSLLRERLVKLLKEKEKTNRESVRSKDAYDKPSWAYLQADSLGYERALNEIISLLESK